MSLVTRLEQEMSDAMLARDNERRDALRLILSSLKSAEKELLRPLSEDEELQVLQRERKKRIEAVEAFRSGGGEEAGEGGGRREEERECREGGGGPPRPGRAGGGAAPGPHHRRRDRRERR